MLSAVYRVCTFQTGIAWDSFVTSVYVIISQYDSMP